MSGKLEQVLKIKPPNELSFVGPFTQPVSSVMYLSNPSDRKVCFKIKTTAPKKYCVKPNSGVIDPDESVKISVSLQPFEYDPQDKNKHKFMVQSMYAPEGEIYQEQLWKEVDSSQLMDSKLKCVFVVPETAAGLGGGAAATNDIGSAAAASTNGGSWQQPADATDAAAAATAAAAINRNQDSASDNRQSVAAVAAGAKVAAEKLSQGDMLLAGQEGDANLKQSTEEIKKLREELSALRQENIQLREESLRQQRLASSRGGGGGGLSEGGPISSSSAGSGSDGFSVSAMNPDANALSVNYLYMALFVLVLGIILGKWIF